MRCTGPILQNTAGQIQGGNLAPKYDSLEWVACHYIFSRQRAASSGRSALTLRVRAQKHGSESIITRVDPPYHAKPPWRFHIINRGTLGLH
jgi:hypothetical protein